MGEKAWSGNESLPLSVAQRVDAACNRFERVWQEGGRPAIEDFLADLPERERPALLGELVPLEAVHRRNAGEAPRPEDYQARFPDLDPAWLALVLLPLSDQPSAKPSSDPAGGTRTQRLRCPHCQSPIQLADSQGDVVLCPGCGSSFHVRDAHPTSTRAMRQVGKFQLLERVGLGAFGAVWKARDTELDRIVALKIPHTGLLTADADLERFHREARAAAQLRHPGIVTVHEVRTLEGLPTIVADFIHGVTLRDLLDIRRLTFREAATLIAEVAETLDYAHQMGLVHRDLKPANIMIEAPRPRLDDNDLPGEEAAAEPNRIGRPLVMDFGLALRDEAETTMTTDGLVLGTPAYMSPEQAAGKSHQADRRSDVYSLGVILYELLTGELPFRGNARLIIYQVQHEEPRPPRKLNDKIPRDLETVCLKAMAKVPGWRYATARELAEDLRRFLKGELIQARPAGRVERGWKWARRHPAQAAAYALVVLVLGLGGVGGAMTWLWQQAVVARQQAEGDRGQAEAARQQAVRAREQLAGALSGEQQAKQQAEAAQEKFRQLMYLRAVDLAHREWKDNNLVRAEQLLAGCPADLRRWEWHYVHHLCHADLFTLTGHTGPVTSVAFSPDGKRLASASWDKIVKVWDAVSGQEALSLKGHTGIVYSVAFSPNGQRLASASYDKTVKVWDAASGQVALTLKGHTSWVLSVAFSPDGQRLASASHDKTVKVWDAVTGQVAVSLKVSAYSVAFSPDGKRLASGGSGDPTVKVWDAASGQEFLSLKGHTDTFSSVAFSPDGKRLASASYDQTVKVWDMASGQEFLSLKGHTGEVTSVAFSPDGKRLASASDDKTVKVWDAASGQVALTLKGHSGPVKSVAFSPDGQRLASASYDKTVKVWDAASGQVALTLKGHTSWVLSVAFSPDGRRLASTSTDSTVRVWDAVSGQEALSLTGHTSYVRSVAFSPDGKRLASAAGDGTVKVWDAGSGQEVLSLKGHRFSTSVAFSPEGGRLAFAGEDGTVRLWDGRPWTPALQVEREASGLLVFLREQALLKADIVQRLRADLMISESVRKQALLFAEQVRDDPERLNHAAWDVVRWPGRSVALYRQALHAAEVACRTSPENGNSLNTLGVAQYRVGRYAEAVDTLRRSHALNMAPTRRKAFLEDLGGILMSPWRAPGTRSWAYAQPADVAFLALAHARLGHDEEARLYRAWLRYLLQQGGWATHDESQAFLREVEAMLHGNEAPSRK